MAGGLFLLRLYLNLSYPTVWQALVKRKPPKSNFRRSAVLGQRVMCRQAMCRLN